jgi:hypothetical protein
MGSTAEDGLSEGRKVDLLAKMRRVALKKFVGIDTIRQLIVSCKVATVEGEKKISHPRVLALSEDIENWMKEKFSEVVDAGRDESSNAEVISPLVSLLGGKLVDIDACEVEKGSAVVVREVHFALKEGLAGFIEASRVLELESEVW